MTEVQETAIQLRNEIGKAKTLLTSVDLHAVFNSAETIVGLLAYLISPIVEMESKYRQMVYQFEEQGMTHAKAESKAKASSEYAEWKKYSLLYDLAHEQVMLLKKFKDKLANEELRS